MVVNWLLVVFAVVSFIGPIRFPFIKRLVTFFDYNHQRKSVRRFMQCLTDVNLHQINRVLPA